MNWNPPLKPAELTEKRLVDAILDGYFPIGAKLPAERELAAQLGTTRPTLREALQRLGRDGWLDIQQGKPTRVRDYWKEGNLNLLATIARHLEHLPPDFVPNLLAVRLALAPAYTRGAIEKDAICIQALLKEALQIEDSADTYAAMDWEIHRQLTICSGNPVFTLILNGFKEMYPVLGAVYFQEANARKRSRRFYQDLLACAQKRDAEGASEIARQTMADSLEIWQRSAGE